MQNNTIINLWENNGGGLYLEREAPEHIQYDGEDVVLCGLQFAEAGLFAEDAASVDEWAPEWCAHNEGPHGPSYLTPEQFAGDREHPETVCVAEWSTEHGLRILASPGSAARDYIGLPRGADWAVIARLLQQHPDGVPIALLRFEALAGANGTVVADDGEELALTGQAEITCDGDSHHDLDPDSPYYRAGAVTRAALAEADWEPTHRVAWAIANPDADADAACDWDSYIVYPR